MRKLRRLNFAAKPRVAHMAMGLASIATAFVAGIAWRAVDHPPDGVPARLRAVENVAQAAPLEAAMPDSNSATMREELDRPWPEVLSAVEGLGALGMTIESLEIGPGDGLAVVDVQAGSREAILKAVTTLRVSDSQPSHGILWELRWIRVRPEGIAEVRLVARHGHRLLPSVQLR